MILTPGSVFFYSGMLLLVFGNTFGVFLALIMMVTGFWLWQKEDQGYLDYDDEDEDGCPICGAAPGQPCRTSPRSDAEPAPTYRPNLKK